MSTLLDERTALDDTDTMTILDEEVLTSNDKPNCSHIVMVPEGETDQTPQAYVLRARVEGFPVTALCGFTWVPNKQAKGLAVCAECKAIFEHDPHGKGDRDQLPEE